MAKDLSKMTEVELDAEMDALDRVMEATQILLRLKPGDVLTEETIAELVFLDSYHEQEQEHAVNVFHRGYECGLQRGAGADTAKLIEERDAGNSAATVANALSSARARSAFVLGAQVCREMMARFVEQGGDATTAQSIRANWRPTWGDDPGPPSEGQYELAAPCEISCKAPANA